MTARTRALVTTLALLAAAAGAVAFAWFGIEKKDQAAEATKVAQENLFAFATADVKAVAVEAKGELTRLARAGDGWRVEAPVAAAAERAAVDALVEKVAGLRRKAAVTASPDGAALERYGLARPRAKVTVTLASGKAETLALGDENPFDGTAFVRTTGGAVELVDGDVKWSVERTTFELREKRLLPFDERELSRVEVVTPRLSYALARDRETWRVDAPVKDRADEATVSRVLSAIRGLRATSFARPAREDGARTAAGGRWKVTIVPASGPSRTLLLEAPAPRRGAAAPPLRARLEGATELATLADGAARDLDQDPFALRDKTVLRFDRDQVKVAQFTVGGVPFEGRRDAGAARLASVLFSLSSLQARAFADESGTTLAAHGLDRPAIEILLLGDGGKELGRLIVSSPRGGKTFAKSSSSPRIVEIDRQQLASLPRSAEDLKESPAPERASARAPAGTDPPK